MPDPGIAAKDLLYGASSIGDASSSFKKKSNYSTGADPDVILKQSLLLLTSLMRGKTWVRLLRQQHVSRSTRKSSSGMRAVARPSTTPRPTRRS